MERRVENRVRFYKNPLFIKTRFLFKQESADALAFERTRCVRPYHRQRRQYASPAVTTPFQALFSLVLRRATPAFARVESGFDANFFSHSLRQRAPARFRVARASASRSRRGAGVACFLSRVRASWPPGARGDREVAGLAAVALFAPASRSRSNAVVRAAQARVSVARIVLRAGVPSPDGVFGARYAFRRASRIVPFRRRLASCVRSFEPSLTRSSCILSYNCIAVMGSAKSAVRLKAPRVLRRLGLPPVLRRAAARRARRARCQEGRAPAEDVQGHHEDPRVPHRAHLGLVRNPPRFDPRVRFSFVVAFSGRRVLCFLPLTDASSDASPGMRRTATPTPRRTTRSRRSLPSARSEEGPGGF